MTGHEASPLEMQMGGDHYKKQAVQPIEFTMMNRWDACSHSALKYLTRWSDKGTPVLDLEKARHFCQLREATMKLATGKNGETFNWRTAMTMQGYIDANGFSNRDHIAALLALENVVHLSEIDPNVYTVAIHKIDVLLSETKSQLRRGLSAAD